MAEISDGDVALDNLEYKREPCQVDEGINYYLTLNTYNSYHYLHRVILFPDYSCDFESGTCGWDVGNGDFRWERFPPDTETNEGTIEDHTTASRSGKNVSANNSLIEESLWN